MRQVPPQLKTPEAMQMKMTVPRRWEWEGDSKRDEVTIMYIQFPFKWEIRKGFNSGAIWTRKEGGICDQVWRICENLHEKETGNQQVSQREGWPNMEPVWYQQVKSVVCLLDVSNVRLMHEEASCQHNPKVCHPLQVWLGRTLRAAFGDRVSLISFCPDERKFSLKKLLCFSLTSKNEFLSCKQWHFSKWVPMTSRSIFWILRGRKKIPQKQYRLLRSTAFTQTVVCRGKAQFKNPGSTIPWLWASYLCSPDLSSFLWKEGEKYLF